LSTNKIAIDLAGSQQTPPTSTIDDPQGDYDGTGFYHAKRLRISSIKGTALGKPKTDTVGCDIPA
jgi:hypothetical protein